MATTFIKRHIAKLHKKYPGTKVKNFVPLGGGRYSIQFFEPSGKLAAHIHFSDADTRKNPATKTRGTMTEAQKTAFVARMAKARGTGSKRNGKKAAAKGDLKDRLQAVAQRNTLRGRFGAEKVEGRAKGKGTRKNTAKRRNTGEAVDKAADRYKFFHGREPGVINDIETPIKTFGVLSGIGKLERMIINAVDGKHVVELEFKGTFLAQDSGGRQLFIEGGDQSVRVEDFGIPARKSRLNEILGSLLEVWYHTRKDHLVPEDGGTAVYQHKFGMDENLKPIKGARLPVVMYDKTNKLLHIAGGNYTILAEGISG